MSFLNCLSKWQEKIDGKFFENSCLIVVFLYFSLEQHHGLYGQQQAVAQQQQPVM